MLATLRGLLRSITPLERKVVFAVTLVLVVLTVIPPLYGWAMAERAGMAWIGKESFSLPDFTVYLSAIDQAKSGKVLTEDLFTTEAVPPVFNVLWYSVGRFAHLFSLTPLQAFHASRLLLIPLLTAVSYLAIAFFLADRRMRIAAFLLLAFGSGFGVFFAPFLPSIPLKNGLVFVQFDYAGGESNIFKIMGYSPHFVASLALWIFTVLILAVAFEKRSLAGAAGAGFVAGLLFQFHPYHAPVIYAIAAAWCVLAGAKHGWARAPWLELAAFIGVSVPAVAYHYFLIHVDAQAIAHAMTNLTVTPPIIYLLIGFGAISFLWLPGVISASRSGVIPRERLVLLVSWIVVQGTMLYAPFRFQRRFLEGLQFPLTVLTTPALFDLYDRMRLTWRVSQETILVAGSLALALVFLSTTAAEALSNVKLYSDPSDAIFFTDKSEERAALWLRSHAPLSAAILSTPDIGNDLVGLAGRRVYAGHWSETIDIAGKTREIDWFYRDADDAARAAFLKAHGLTFVYFGPTERALAVRSFGPAFERVFEESGVEIYALRRTGL